MYGIGVIRKFKDDDDLDIEVISSTTDMEDNEFLSPEDWKEEISTYGADCEWIKRVLLTKDQPSKIHEILLQAQVANSYQDGG